MKKGNFFEILVGTIQESYRDNPKTEILRNTKIKNKSNQDREFDIVIKSIVNSFEILVVIECKDYSKKVPVKEIEAFACKCERVAGINKKIFVSKNGYQKDAINAAKDFDILLYEFEDLKADEIRAWTDMYGLKELTTETFIVECSLLLDSTTHNPLSNEIYLFSIQDETVKIELNEFIHLYFQNRIIEMQEQFISIRNSHSTNGNHVNSIDADYVIYLNETGTYIKEDEKLYQVLEIRITLRYVFIEEDVVVNTAKAYIDTANNKINAKLLNTVSEKQNKMMTLIKKTEEENHLHIFISKPDGSPLDKIPSIIVPEGVEVKVSINK